MLGVADRELEDVGERPRAELLEQQQPAAERAGHARGEQARSRARARARARGTRSIVAAAGATPCAHSTSGLPASADQNTAGRSPPGPFRCGSTTWRTKPAAHAASNALPPRSSTAIPACVASQCVDATAPNVPRNSGRVVNVIRSLRPVGTARALAARRRGGTRRGGRRRVSRSGGSSSCDCGAERSSSGQRVRKRQPRRRLERAREVALEHDALPRPLHDRDRERRRPTAATACTGASGRRTARAVGASSTILPRYMTATRSQRYSTVARSCVMKRHEKPSSCCRSRSRLRIDACTETSSADTGSSATRSAGDTRERARETDALALAAGQLVRIAEAQLVAQTDLVEQLDHLRVEVAAAREPLHVERLADDLPARHARVERRVRILEHHVHVAAQRPQRAAREVRDVRAVQPDRAVGRRDEPHDAVRDRALAAAGLADEPERARRARSRTTRRRPRARRPFAPKPRTGKCLTRPSTSSTGCVASPLRALDGSRRRGGAARSRAARAPASARARRRAGSAARTRSAVRQLGERRHAARDLLQPARRRGRGTAPSRPIVYGCCGRANRSCTGASSTLRPAYMTSTRSAMSATTPRLCVIRTIAVPSRSRMSRIRSRIPAWIVTSSAVVGSSAIRIFGSHASAIAIITRCRIPPESWCGYSSTRRSGDGMRTRSSSSIVRRRASPRESDEMASQHLADLVADLEGRVERRHRLLEDERDLASADRAAAARSRPRAGRRRRTAPRPSTTAVSGSSRSSDMKLTLLPQPDSPTTPSTSPSPSVNDSWSTACTGPSSVSNRTERSLDLEQAHRVVRGSKTSRSPSPSRLNDERAEEDRDARDRRRAAAPARGTTARPRASRPTTASAAARRGRGTTARLRR